jgi:transposase
LATYNEEINKEMITVEAWTSIRYLHAQGKSVRAIARELGISRNTVRAALASNKPPKYVRPARPNPQLKPYVDQIREMLEEKEFIGTRILREIRGKGYKGSTSALYVYLGELKQTRSRTQVTMRFETPPARQAQFDWSVYTIVLGSQVIKVTIFCLTLAYSRRKFYWASLDASQTSIFEAIEAGLHYFGGAPKELLVDNPRAFVSDARPDHFAWNTHFLELCGHYCIQPRACQVRRAQTKGKVERPFFYLEQHFIKGNQWDNFEAFVRDLAAFAAGELDHRIHSTTGEAPIERFAAERDLLTPLPTIPFVGSYARMQKVSRDSLVSFGGCRYSVPWQYAGKQVWLRPSQGRYLVILSQAGQTIAQHTLSDQKKHTVLVPAHYEGLRREAAKTRVVLEEQFLSRFPGLNWFTDALLTQHKNNTAQQLRGILSLADTYAPQAMLAAFEQARSYNTYSHAFIRGLLESHATSSPASPSPQPTQPPTSQVGADLSIYQHILETNQ